MNHQVVKDRALICTQCPFWHPVDRCRKGHILQSALGCPIKKFPPVGGAGFATDRPAKDQVVRSKCGACGGGGESKPMSATETVFSLAKTLDEWRKSGFELATTEVQQKRMEICKQCQNFDGTRCKVCHCVMAIKSRLETAVCPAGYWS